MIHCKLKTETVYWFLTSICHFYTLRKFIVKAISSIKPFSSILFVLSDWEHFNFHALLMQRSWFFEVHDVQLDLSTLRNICISLNTEIKPKIVTCRIWIWTSVEIVFLVLMWTSCQDNFVKIATFKVRIKNKKALVFIKQTFLLSVKYFLIHSFIPYRCIILIIRQNLNYFWEGFWIIKGCMLDQIREFEWVRVLLISHHSMNIIRVSRSYSWVDLNSIFIDCFRIASIVKVKRDRRIGHINFRSPSKLHVMLER